MFFFLGVIRFYPCYVAKMIKYFSGVFYEVFMVMVSGNEERKMNFHPNYHSRHEVPSQSIPRKLLLS